MGIFQARNKIEPNKIAIPEFELEQSDSTGNDQLTMGLPGDNVSLFDLDQQGVNENGQTESPKSSTLSNEEKARRAFEATGLTSAVEVFEPKKSTHKQIVEIMNKLGRDVVFYSAKGKIAVPDGFVFGSDNTLYINANQNTDNMVWHNVGHEFFHTIKNNSKHKELLYDPLIEYAKESFTTAQKTAFLDTYTDVPLIQAQLMKDENALLEEMLADEMGNPFVDKSFWQGIFDFSKELFGKMVSVIESILNKISGAKYETFISKEVSQNLKEQFTAVIGIVMTDNNTNSSELDKTVNNVSYKIRAYHGTPHDFDKFSTDAIGTGEGAQAYGWGLYFAGNKSIAEWYRDNLSKRALKYKGRELKVDKDLHYEDIEDFTPVENNIISFVLGELERYADPTLEKAIYGAKLQYREFDEMYSNMKKEGKGSPELEKRHNFVKDALAQFDEITSQFKSGRLYEVDLSPDDEHMLDWDKPLSEQSDFVKEKLEKSKELFDSLADYFEDYKSGWNPPEPNDTDDKGSELYKSIKGAIDNDYIAVDEYFDDSAITVLIPQVNRHTRNQVPRWFKPF